MKRYGVSIAGTGSYVPPRIMTNKDLESIVETTDEWIRTRTGIEERHIAADNEPASVLGYEAAKRALEAANVKPEEVELIVVATFSGDAYFPNAGCFIQRQLGAVNAACFALEAACSGFIYGLEVVSGLIRSGMYSTVLLVGAEKISSFVDWTDRNTCVLFGDGAGAVVLKRVPEEQDMILASKLGADGRQADLVQIPAGGSAMPLSQEVLDKRLNFIRMEGREVFKLAVNAMVGACQEVLKTANVPMEQVRWLVPHQANMRIISAVGKYLNFPDEKVYVNLNRFGNTSAASVPLAFDEMVRAGKVQRGDYVLMTAFGGGLTWGAALLRW